MSAEENMDPLTIRELIDDTLQGQIRIPSFQRGFVWEPDRVAYLMDSIYKGFPFGSLLFWRTDEQLRIERDLGPFKLPPPKADYPIDYVLDGQQRVTAIFACSMFAAMFASSFFHSRNRKKPGAECPAGSDLRRLRRRRSP